MNKKHAHPLTFAKSYAEARIYSSFRCDICEKSDISGYHCFTCGYYDVCISCYRIYEGETKFPLQIVENSIDLGDLQKRIAELTEENKQLKQRGFLTIDVKQLESLTIEELNKYEEKCVSMKRAIRERKVMEVSITLNNRWRSRKATIRKNALFALKIIEILYLNVDTYVVAVRVQTI